MVDIAWRKQTEMQLNISSVTQADFGMYHCLSKNEVGTTKGIFNVYGKQWRILNFDQKYAIKIL